MKENPYALNADELQKFLPHRPPFLMLDRILEIHPTGDLKDFSSTSHVGTRVVAMKNIAMNEPYLQGHFPGFAIFPGVLNIEAMAQAAAVSLYPVGRELGEWFSKSFKCQLLGVDSARFRKPVVPGDQLRVETVVKKVRGTIWIFDAKTTVDGQVTAEAEIIANFYAENEK